MVKTRPFLKWAGNKYRCLDHILKHFPAANRLIEPFTGSAAVFLNSRFSTALLAEENQDLVHLFTYLQQEGDEFIADCRRFFCKKYNTESQYYELRDRFNHSKNPRERASIFLYLNRHGYNGLCRYNQKGIYNVPFGYYQKPYFPLQEMRLFHQKSQCAQFVHSDFRLTFALAKSGDVIYCDPPYAPINQTSNFSHYVHKYFGEEEQIQLAELAMTHASKGAHVFISNHDTPFTRYQYRYGEIKSFNVTRTISCKGDNRIAVKELLAVFSP